jgi:hypothetical protein
LLAAGLPQLAALRVAQFSMSPRLWAWCVIGARCELEPALGDHPQWRGLGRLAWPVLDDHPRTSGARDLPLLLVVERQAEGIPEGHQRPLHGVGFGFLEGGFMGLAQVGVDAVAGAAALADQRRLARCPRLTLMRTRAV